MRVKRILGLVLSLLIVFSCVQSALAVETAEADTILDGEKIELAGEGGYEFKFVPEISGNYVFRADGMNEIEGYVFDASYDFIAHDNTGSGNVNSFCYYYSLTAGKTYYLYLTIYEFKSGITVLSITKSCDHVNKTEYPTKAPGCTEDGYTEGTYCNDCSRWIYGHTKLSASHIDENGDRVCEICLKEAVNSQGKLNDAGSVTFKLYANKDFVISGNGSIDWCFNWNNDAGVDETKVKRIFIGEGITTIKEDSFYCYESNDYEIHFPESLETIEEGAFAYDFRVKELYIPSKLKLEYTNAFNSSSLVKYTVSSANPYYESDECGVLFNKGKTELLSYPSGAPGESYTVPEGVVRLEDDLFGYAVNLKNVTVAQSVRDIGIDVFSDNILENAYTEDNVTYYSDIAVGVNVNCLDEVTIKIKDGTRLVCDSHLSNAASGTIELPDSLLGIGRRSFNTIECKYVDIPASVEFIGINAYNNDSLEKYIVNENNRFYSSSDEGILFNKDKTVLIQCPVKYITNSYTVPETVKEIAGCAFMGCFQRYVFLPDGLEIIGSGAFSNSRLQSVDLPETVNTIGSFAFSNSNLYDIVIPKSTDFIGYGAFETLQSVAILNESCVIEAQNFERATALIVGYDGSSAQSFTSNNSCSFYSISGEHKHVHFGHTVTPATCTQNGTSVYYCPCGNSEQHTANMGRLQHEYITNYEEETYKCMYCSYSIGFDGSQEQCDCICHRGDFISMIVGSFLKVFWKLFNIKQVCECGVSHY